MYTGRTELDNFDLDNAWDIINLFEQKIANFCGSPYAVSVDSCTNALFLCLKYIDKPQTITIPNKTYVSVPNTILNAGYNVKFEDFEWSGNYPLRPLDIIDSAVRFKKDMYTSGFQCISFHRRKIIPIGKGGMILTDYKDAYEWFRRARYCGRIDGLPYDKHKEFTQRGWNMYMTPEDAARGLLLFDNLLKKSKNFEDMGGSKSYSDLSKSKIFTD